MTRLIRFLRQRKVKEWWHFSKIISGVLKRFTLFTTTFFLYIIWQSTTNAKKNLCNSSFKCGLSYCSIKTPTFSRFYSIFSENMKIRLLLTLLCGKNVLMIKVYVCIWLKLRSLCYKMFDSISVVFLSDDVFAGNGVVKRGAYPFMVCRI